MREYVGTGYVAELAAELDAIAGADRTGRREDVLAEQERLRTIDTSVDTLIDVVGLLTRSSLTLTGYHQHNRGEWRKRHASEEK